MTRQRAILSVVVSVALGSFLAIMPPAIAMQHCVGDCNGDGEVKINELITGVNIALNTAFVDTCLNFDSSNDGSVAINELITGVNCSLSGCVGANANYVAIHDWASPDFDDDCVSCHNEKPDEASLDPLVPGYHKRKLDSPIVPGATPNDKCIFCHTAFDLSVNRSAAGLRRFADITTCAACHSGGVYPFYQPQ